MPEATIPYFERYHTITRKCFTCNIEKPLSAFSPNKRKYQIPRYKGMCLNCDECIIERTLKDLSCVKYNHQTNRYELHKFNSKDEVLEWYDNKLIYEG